MRSVDRLDAFYVEMNKLHKSEMPDIRVGQLFFNFNVWLSNKYNIDMYFLEEDELFNYMKEFCGEEN